MYNGTQIAISKEAAAEIEKAVNWARSLADAMLQAHMKGNEDLAVQLFKEHEDALLNIRMVMLMNGLPVQPLKAKVILPF